MRKKGSFVGLTVAAVALLIALQTPSLAQVTSYEEAKQRTVEAYQQEPINYSTSRTNAVSEEYRLFSGYISRLGQLCFAVRGYKMSLCNRGDGACVRQVIREYEERYQRFKGELVNHFADRRDKINRYWDKAEQTTNRHDGRDGRRYVDKVPKERKQFYARRNYRGEIQVEINGRRTWVHQDLLGRYYYDQQNGRYYYLYGGRKVYAAGN